MANLHNARRANTPMVNIPGDQATYHRPLDAPLTADTEGWARGVSGWVRTAADVRTVGADAAAAVQAAMVAPGQIATLILPSDTSWNEGGTSLRPWVCIPTPRPNPDADCGCAARAAPAGKQERAAPARGRRRWATSVRLLARRDRRRRPAAGWWRKTPTPVMARGRGAPQVERVPYVVERRSRRLGGSST